MVWQVKIGVFIIGILVLCIFSPNLIWLARSTTRVTNEGTTTLIAVRVDVDEEQVELGSLDPGESRLIFLPKSGDATYSVYYENGEISKSTCKEYVGQDMYHVETKLEDSKGLNCLVSLPFFSELLVLKTF